MLAKKNFCVTAKQMQHLDKAAINTLGIPSCVLMENAGRAVAEEAIKGPRSGRKKRISIVCGFGNNAGDGFVAARHLFDRGFRVCVFCLSKESRLKADTLTNFRILKKLNVPLKFLKCLNPQTMRLLGQSDIVVDAIFGTGLNRGVEGSVNEFIEALNSLKKNIIAVDIPSGLDGTTGNIWGACLKAKKTVTLGLPKKGLFVNEGPRMSGKITVADIGIPVKLVKKIIR